MSEPCLMWGRLSPRKKRTMRRRAFTLIETMIVVLIVTAISAIFLPTIAARMTDGKLGHATRSIEAGAALAAAEAMERSTIIAYVAEQWGDEWVLYAEDVDPSQIGVLLTPAEPGLDMPPQERETRRQELVSFAGVQLTDMLPPAMDEEFGPAPIGGAGGDLSSAMLAQIPLDADEAGRVRFVLAVFFADGSCRVGPKMYLVADDGKREVVHLHPLTGRIESRRLASVSEELEQIEGADEAEASVPMPETPSPGEPSLTPGGGP